MTKSTLSAASRARRDAIFQKIRASRPKFPIEKVERQLETSLKQKVLDALERRRHTHVSADKMHYEIDRQLWLSVFPSNRNGFTALFPQPPATSEVCPEYEAHRARVLAKQEAEDLAQLKKGSMREIPDQLWEMQGCEGMEDMGISKWTITLPESMAPFDNLVAGNVDRIISPWTRPVVVHLGQAGASCSLTMRFYVTGVTPQSCEIACQAWADFFSWFYDLTAGSRVSLAYWVKRADEWRGPGRATPRSAASLRQLVAYQEQEKRQQDAVALFHAKSMLAKDRETYRDQADVIGRRLDNWWSCDLLAQTGLDKARHCNIGWWLWHTEAKQDLRRSDAEAEAEAIVQMYEQRGIAPALVKDAIRQLLTLRCGPLEGTEHAAHVIEVWVAANPERIPLPVARLRSLAFEAASSILPNVAPLDV